MASAFACAGCVASDHVARLFGCVVDVISVLDSVDLSQLYQFWLFVRVEHPNLCVLEPRAQNVLRKAYTRATPQP